MMVKTNRKTQTIESLFVPKVATIQHTNPHGQTYNLFTTTYLLYSKNWRKNKRAQDKVTNTKGTLNSQQSFHKPQYSSLNFMINPIY